MWMVKSKISVIICTFNRAESLRETMRLLAEADCSGLDADIIVVDNGSSDHTRGVAEAFSHILPVRYIYEPTKGTYGKIHALNRGISADNLGDLVVLLDDDLSVASDWFQAVRNITDRHPDADLFTGQSYVIWPDEAIPPWAKYPDIQGWLLSITGCGANDRPMQNGRWFSTNYFWFRSRVLTEGRCFEDKWNAEAAFILSVVEDGFQAMQGPDAVVGHRVQPHLLDPTVALQRAELSGRSSAAFRLLPVRRTVHQSQLALKYPVLVRIYCILRKTLWNLECRRLQNVGPDKFAFGRKLMATERRALFREYFRILITAPEYQLFQ